MSALTVHFVQPLNFTDNETEASFLIPLKTRSSRLPHDYNEWVLILSADPELISYNPQISLHNSIYNGAFVTWAASHLFF